MLFMASSNGAARDGAREMQPRFQFRMPEPENAKVLAKGGHPYLGAALTALWIVCSTVAPIAAVLMLKAAYDAKTQPVAIPAKVEVKAR